MTDLAELLLRDTAAAGLLSGAVVFVLLEAAKRLGWSDPGREKIRKVLTALLVSLLLTAARQQVAGEWNAADLIGGTLAAFLVAAGIHGTQRPQIKSEAVRLK